MCSEVVLFAREEACQSVWPTITHKVRVVAKFEFLERGIGAQEIVEPVEEEGLVQEKKK